MQPIDDVLPPQILEGVRAGTLAAIRKARNAGTKLAIWREGKVVEITPDEAEEMLREAEKTS